MNQTTFRQVLSYMKGYRILYTIGVIGFALLLLMFQVQIALLFLQLFNAVQEGSFRDILTPLIRFSVLIVALIAAIPLFSYLTAKAAVQTTGALRKTVFDKMTALPVKTFKETHSAELSSIATNDLNEVEKAYAQYFFIFAVQLISGVGAGIIMFFIEWRLALIAMAAGLLTFITNSIYAKRLRGISRDVQDCLGTLNTKLSNILAGIHVIRIFNIQKYVLKIFTRSNQATLDVSKVRVKRQATIDALNTFIFSVSFAGITIAGGYLVLEGIIMLGVIVAIIQLQNSVLELVQGLGGFIANMQTALAAGDRIVDFLALEEEPKAYLVESLYPVPKNAISFEQVGFGYGAVKTVEGISFTVKHGETVALVGPSGGGKSTLFKLLLHFYPLDRGCLGLLGQSTAQIPLSALRAKMAYVPQDAFLFNTTLKENIRYGRPDATDEDIIKAAQTANAHLFIEAFEAGYDTVVGEHGTKLSGGQRQRIAIARAILKDAPILLLDEATSALDSASETLVQEALEQLQHNRTTLIIAHRLSTIKEADRILVIHAGAIIEQGTHETLLENPDSMYAKLYDIHRTGELTE